jgi:general secretion pathway protein D
MSQLLALIGPALRFGRAIRPGGVFAAIVLLFVAIPAAGLAGPTSSPAVLSRITLDADAQGRPRLLLSFDPATPQYAIVANDNPRPMIAFAGAIRGPNAAVPPQAPAALKSAIFEQRDGSLTLAFPTGAPMRLIATPAADRGLYLTLAAADQAEGAGPGAPPGAASAYVDRAEGEDGFEVVRLKYADVSEVVGLLTSDQTVRPNDTFTPQEPAFGSAGMANNNTPVAPNLAAMGPNALGEAANPSVGRTINDAIGVDRRLNAIILRGSPERIARLKEKIAKIDQPITSVILETVFVELDRTGAKNVGFDFNNTSSQIAVATYDTGGFMPGGTAAKSLTSVSLQAAIYAQVQDGRGRIISRPRISAQSGASAKIITGDALPILTAITLSGVNGVSQQVQYVTVGVTLQIAPRVSEDGFVTSHVFCEVSSVTGYSQGYPTISQREASTSATVRDGDSFVIGGLTEENELSNNSKIPVAGSVPLLGGLFQHRSSTSAKTELYIVVTPHIIRGGDELEARRERDLASASGANSAATPTAFPLRGRVQ